MTLQEKRTMMLSLIARWKESGMSQVDFARSHQVELTKFRYWVSRQRKDQRGAPDFIELNGFSLPGINISIRTGLNYRYLPKLR